MSTTPAIDWTRNGTSTPSKYRFVLSFVLHSEIGNLELKHAPLEWKEIELLLKRDLETHGVYITAVVNSLTFIKEGKNLLQDLYASKGVFSICNLFIYYLDHATRTYVSMPSSYKLDFNTYKLVNLTKTTNGITISALPTDIISKFQQRKNTEVDLNKLFNIDGGAIAPGPGTWESLSIPAIKVNKRAVLATSGTGNLTGVSYSTTYIYVPLTLGNSEITEAITEIGIPLVARDAAYGIIVGNVYESTRIFGTIYLHLNSFTEITSLTLRLSVVNPDGSEADGHNLHAPYTSDFTGIKKIVVDESITVTVGTSLAIIVTVEFAGAFTFDISFTDSAITLTQLYIASTSILTKSWPIYRAIQRNLQIILGQQFPFYSEFFGLTDIPYNVADDCYASESQLRFANLVTGLNIRGGLLMDHTFPMKFTDLFKTLRAGWAIGGGFETVYGPILTANLISGGSGYLVDDVLTVAAPAGGTSATITVKRINISGAILSFSITTKGTNYTKGAKGTTGGTGSSATINVLSLDAPLFFRIEELSHFYQEVEVLDLSARVNEIEIEREQDSSSMFAKLKTGYSKYEYETIMGRGEYNTENNRTTVVPNDNEFDNISPLRADTRGVLEMRLKPYDSTETEDVTGDEDVFIIKSQRGSGYWNAELEENVAVEENTSLFDKSLNLYLTPVRNLIRNGQEINVGLALVPGTPLTYQTSDKNNLLKTTGEGYTVTENQNIIVDETGTNPHLTAPLWYPELLNVTLPFYEADYVLLSANPLGYIKLSDTLSGWVREIKWTFAQNSATLKLKRRIIPLPS